MIRWPRARRAPGSRLKFTGGCSVCWSTYRRRPGQNRQMIVAQVIQVGAKTLLWLTCDPPHQLMVITRRILYDFDEYRDFLCPRFCHGLYLFWQTDIKISLPCLPFAVEIHTLVYNELFFLHKNPTSCINGLGLLGPDGELTALPRSLRCF